LFQRPLGQIVEIRNPTAGERPHTPVHEFEQLALGEARFREERVLQAAGQHTQHGRGWHDSVQA
jgi:hypothetical protein